MLLSSSCLIFMSHHDVICFLAWLKHFVWTWSHQDPSVSAHRATSYNKLKHMSIFQWQLSPYYGAQAYKKHMWYVDSNFTFLPIKFFSSFRTTPSIVTCSNDKLKVLCRKNVINKRDFVVSMFKLWHLLMIANLKTLRYKYRRSKCMQNRIDHYVMRSRGISRKSHM